MRNILPRHFAAVCVFVCVQVFPFVSRASVMTRHLAETMEFQSHTALGTLWKRRCMSAPRRHRVTFWMHGGQGGSPWQAIVSQIHSSVHGGTAAEECHPRRGSLVALHNQPLITADPPKRPSRTPMESGCDGFTSSVQQAQGHYYGKTPPARRGVATRRAEIKHEALR